MEQKEIKKGISKEEFIRSLHNIIVENRQKKVKEEQEKKKKTVYSIDWLTINIQLRDPSNIIINIDTIYKVRRERGTNIFQHIDDYYSLKDEYLFTIVSTPHSSILDISFAQLQIANKWLYVGDLNKLLYKIFFHANFEYQAISRIDICADFYYFDHVDQRDGTFLEPLEFINNFAKGKVAKTNPSSFTLWGKTADYDNDYHCLNIGESKSVFSWKLYNKSREQRKVHTKKYIIQKWERDLIDYEADRDVWRLEVSIKNVNKLTLKSKTMNLNNTLDSWLSKYPYYFLLFVTKKFVFKDELGNYIDFFKLPLETLQGAELSTNLRGKFDYSSTIKEKKKIIDAMVKIVGDSETEEQILEYIEKIQELIQDEDYYAILSARGLSLDVLYSYYSNKFDKEKFKKPVNS